VLNAKLTVIARTSRLLAVFVIWVGVTALAAPGEEAHALTDPPVKLALSSSEHVDLALQFLLENSPRKIAGIESSPESQELYGYLMTPPPTAAPSVLTQLRAGAFWAGWEIGSEIWGTFFDSSAPAGEGLTYAADRWELWRPGSLLLSDSSGAIYSPTWGFRGKSSALFSYGRVTDNGACEWELFGDGERIYAPGWVTGTPGCNATKTRNYVLWKQLEPVRCGAGAIHCPGIEPVPYEGTNQPAAPSAAALRATLESELETADYPALNRLYNYYAEPANYPDPRITRKAVSNQERRCDRGTPRFENPGGNASPGAFTKKEEGEYAITSPPEEVESTPVYLRWGTTSWLPSNENFKEPPAVDQWSGWGFRHIVAKHGWTLLDIEETRLALLTPQIAKIEGGGKYVYTSTGIGLGAGGVGCERRVVVDFVAKEGDPVPRGIVTSYNVVIPE
jgi:hypothetical protein